MSKTYSQKPVARKLHTITCICCFKEVRVGIHRKHLCDNCFHERQTDYRMTFNAEEEDRLDNWLKTNGVKAKLY